MRAMEQLRRKDTLAAQQNLLMSQDGIATGPRNRFHMKRAALLEKRGFTEAMHRLCRPYYRPDSRKGGRQSADSAIPMRTPILGPMCENPTDNLIR